MANYLPIKRRIDLRINDDKIFLLNLLTSINEFSPLIKKIESFIRIFEDKLSEEYLKVYPPGFLSLNVGEKANAGLNFIDDILPLGFSLLSLRKKTGYDRLISKLNKTSHERLSAIIEAIFASKYKDGGFQVRLEPPVQNNKLADFKVKKNGEWIYFECKAENLYESDFLKTRSDLFSKIKSEINNHFKNLEIDIWIKRKLTNKDIYLLMEEVKQKLKERVFHCEIDIYGNTFILNQLPDNQNNENVIRVYTCYFGLKEQKRISNLINRAKKQIPTTGNKGIIIIKSNKLEIARCVAREKVSRDDFNNIIAIVIIEMGKGEIILNPNNQEFLKEFIDFCISGSLPSFFC